ncbi:LamG domain-containing protein [Marinobacteraceae bacterium S3BR75-40.1]
MKSLLFILLTAFVLAGCGGGKDTETLPNTGSTTTNSNYDGPAPATDDVQTFKRSLWDNLVSTDRCGACHSTGGQTPTFVNDADINTAYAQANTVVNLDQPGQSRMVTKVAGGHNCWLDSTSACADTLTRYIENWAGGSAGSATQIQLRAPAIKDPGNTKSFPADSSGFSSTVYPLLSSYCSDCHVEGVQTPYFASDDVDVAYDAAQAKIDLNNPAASRFVVRLRDEFHNCWGGDCETSANAMQSAIETYAGSLTAQAVDPDLVTSKALTLLGDGIVANSGGRYQDNVIALYEFKTGEGSTAYDTSGVEPALNLTLTGNVQWVGGWGIDIGASFEDEQVGMVRDGKAQGTTTASKKLHDLITASGEYAIEAWVVPGNITQEEARIITYSGSSDARNFTLSQTLQNYEILHRSSTTDQTVPFATADDDERLQATLQHVVVNFTPGGGRQIYINGEFTGDEDPADGGLLNTWDDSFAFVLGNETDRNSLWEGTLRMVAIHNRALTPEQIQTNFEVGVGQKFYLLFSVAHLIDVPESFIVFQVSQFDSYSYLFSEPFFISLDEDQVPDSIPVKGMRIGINGEEASVGQAYANLDVTLNEAGYTPGSGQPLSDLGTVIALQEGPENDEFFLSFEQLGDNTHVVVEAALPPAPTPSDLDPHSAIGLRTFDEINATMSAVTDVPTTNTAVAETFDTVKQQLPTTEDINGFLSSQQMGVTQLAIRYCDALVSDTSLRSSYFPGFDFSASAGSAFDAAGRAQIIDPLYDRLVGQNLASQPAKADVDSELNNLIDTLTSCAGSCPADRTETVVKATCAAVLGSATTLVQ